MLSAAVAGPRPPQVQSALPNHNESLPSVQPSVSAPSPSLPVAGACHSPVSAGPQPPAMPSRCSPVTGSSARTLAGIGRHVEPLRQRPLSTNRRKPARGPRILLLRPAAVNPPAPPAVPPAATPPAADSCAPPGTSSPYMPPDGSFNYRGTFDAAVHAAGAHAAEARLVAPSFTNVAATRHQQCRRRPRAQAGGRHGRRREPVGPEADRPHPSAAGEGRRFRPLGGHRGSAEEPGECTVSEFSNVIRSQLAAFDGSLNRWRLTRWTSLLPKIAALEPELQGLGDEQLRKRSLSLRYRAKSGEPLARLLVEGYALVREAGRRTINMRHFDVQLLGGIAMFHRSIVEMQTGEGKTLTATLPLYLHGLLGKGCHLATVNDYLARRDAEWMRPIYEALGMTVGVIETEMSQPQRREAYACDVTYGTAKEFGFDFLRDRLLLRRISEGQTDLLGGMLGKGPAGGNEKPVQGEPYFALVDEADSILIDEARTPLIISALPTEEERLAVECYKWSASVIGEFVEDDDYEYDHEKKTVELTREGRQKVRLLPKPPAMDTVGMVNIYQYIERAIMVDREYHLDRQYVVRDGEIVIVDEFTGRLAEGRKWRDGIHQAVEAKQGVEVTVETGQAARITIQDFFLRYEHLAGMTGTAMGSARELRRIYRCHVLPIPTNRPAIRQRLPDRVFGTRRRQMGRRGRGGLPTARRRPAGADRHPLDRQVGRAFAAADARRGSSIRCSTPTTSPPRPTSWPRPDNRAE